MYRLLKYAFFHKLTKDRPYFELLKLNNYDSGKDYDLANIGWSFRTQKRSTIIIFTIKYILGIQKLNGI